MRIVGIAKGLRREYGLGKKERWSNVNRYFFYVFKCPHCGGNQYSASDDADTQCIYCGHQGLEKKDGSESRKTAKLIETKPDYDGDGSAWECENCGLLWEFTYEGPQENNYNYCPKCGVKFDEYVRYVEEEYEDDEDEESEGREGGF